MLEQLLPVYNFYNFWFGQGDDEPESNQSLFDDEEEDDDDDEEEEKSFEFVLKIASNVFY